MSEQNAIAKGLRELRGILQREQRTGTETVALDPEALRLLGEFPLAVSRWKAAHSAGSPADAEGVSGGGAARREEKRTVAVSSAGTPGTGPAVASGSSVAPWEDPPSETGAGEGSSGELPAVVPAGENVRDRLNSIYRQVKACPVCRGMDTLFDTVVFATGNPEADIAFVGEAPGAQEEKQKKPFVGPAGRMLDKIIGAMGLRREDVYISNIVKFRPKKENWRFQGNSNRKPTPEEMAVSVRFVLAELAEVRPKAVVALGGTAAEGLLGEGGSVGSLRGRWHESGGFPVVVTYHPSYLLRKEDGPRDQAMRAKRMVWEDMLMAMERAGLPVSEKQRGYFL